MRQMGLLAVVLGTLAGCNTLRPKSENPVMQPPPRRVSLDDSHIENAEKPESEIKTASAVDDPADDTKVFNASVVARVNGAPVFAGDVLQNFGSLLETCRNRMTPDEYKEVRTALVQMNMRKSVQHRLLAERMKSGLKPEQIKQLDGHIDKMFEPQIKIMEEKFGASSKTELELKLNEHGTTLDAVKESFATERLAIEYVRSKMEHPQPITRPDLVAYYQEHLDEFKVPAKVQWQQIQVSFGQRVNQTDARKKIEQARGALARGQSFEEVVKQFSDGPTASSDGRWDWTNKGSLADQKLEDALYELPIGQPSPILEGRSAYHIVKVLDRQAETHLQFFDLQDEIAKKLESEGQADPEKFVEQLYNAAIIESGYDLSPEAMNSASMRISELFQKYRINPGRK